MRWLVLVSLGLSGCLFPSVALVDSFGDGGTGARGGTESSAGKSMGGTGVMSSGGALGEAGEEPGVQGGRAGMNVGGKAESGGNPSAGGDGGSAVTPPPATNPHAWANWPMPNPVGSEGPNVVSYDTSQPGAVMDNITGLMWQAVASETLMTYDEALTYCADLSRGQYSDWRLPTRIELVSLVDYTVEEPTIDLSAFPGERGDRFWSASHLWGNLGYAHTVHFGRGYTSSWEKTGLLRVRCVRP